ncbi:MAG: response regulator [Candidatus Rokubacteria bacterium]|nr:response regulator [Candidatus Rokubacteria bacterium]
MAGPEAAEHEAFEENQRLALVCHDAAEAQGAIKGALQELGFKVHIAGSPSDAIERMRKIAYEVVVLDEEFQGATPHDNPVLQAIRSMPMASRRYIFVGLLGKQFKTLDNMMAFAKSVNVVVNSNDLPQIKGVLRQGMSDNEVFYRDLHEILREVGKR